MFWKRTLAEAGQHALSAVFAPFDAALSQVETYDLTFAGFGGHPVRGWFLVPKGVPAPMPAVVTYLGYGDGRGLPHDWLTWPAAGYATLIMDTRGQGGESDRAGATADPAGTGNPQTPGTMTRGILDPETYVYRRIFTDAARAVDVAAGHPAVDPARIVVYGGSQGGGIAQAVAFLRPNVRAALILAPFLTHFRRAVEITDTDPYGELVRFFRTQREAVEQAQNTLDYFDGINFAAHARIPARYSVALMDPVCPPSTVFAAFNHYAGPKEIRVWPFNGHESGGPLDQLDNLTYVRALMAGT
jgi:cephalosporin-C deacetylase